MDQKDPLATFDEIRDTKKKDARGLTDRGKSNVVRKEKMPANANVLLGRFDLTLKTNDGAKTCMDLFLIWEHCDLMRHLTVHQSQNTQTSAISLIIALAAIHAFDLSTINVHQAYLPLEQKMSRPVFIKNVFPEFELPSD